MVELPPAMLKSGRGRDQEFAHDEYLYRRVPLQLWDDGEDDIEVDAIELPDMSVVRSKYGHPEWARLESDEFLEWGVVGFTVGDIPAEMLHLGAFTWTFGARHVPLEKNYPHSEVQAYEEGKHVNAKSRLDPNLHLRWREKLLWKIRKIIRPYEDVDVHQDAP